MVRPKVALISRRKVLETALTIIDQDGLAGLSIRRLADALGVNGASLYHHFENKDEILVGAAELALSEVPTPDESEDNWRHWMSQNARNLRNALLEHPGLVPLIVSKRSLGMGVGMLDTSAERLMAEGVPSAAVMPLLDALELFAIGSALHDTQGYSPRGSARYRHRQVPGAGQGDVGERIVLRRDLRPRHLEHPGCDRCGGEGAPGKVVARRPGRRWTRR